MIFEEVYNNYWQKIFRLCLGYVNDYQIAQDIAQDTFIIVWQQLPNFRKDSNIGTWIFRIASNNCLKFIEKEKKFPRSDFPIDIAENEQPDIEPKIQQLYTYISELPEIERIIIALELENIKQSEIAVIVGLSESNIRVKIHRIKEKLTKKFKENER